MNSNYFIFSFQKAIFGQLVVYFSISKTCLQLKISSMILPTSLKNQEIEIYCCFSNKHTAYMSKSKYWLAPSQDVSDWSDISLCSFSELAHKNPTQRDGLIQIIQSKKMKF